MMNLLRKSLAIEIDSFVHFIRGKCAPIKTFTQSAFVQARKKINLVVSSVLKDHLKLIKISSVSDTEYIIESFLV